MAKTNNLSDTVDKTTASNTTTAQVTIGSKTSTVLGLQRELGIPPMSMWANRFIVAAIVQGALTAGVTGYLLLSGIGWLGGFESSKVVASGGAGMWLTVGFLGYIILGPIAAAVTALFYQHLESSLGVVYTGWTRALSWGHLILMNVGVVGATWLMMIAGFLGGGAAQPVSAGGLGWTGDKAGLVHTNIMQYYPPYIAAFIAVAVAGAFLGGLGYVIMWRRSLRNGRASKLK